MRHPLSDGRNDGAVEAEHPAVVGMGEGSHLDPVWIEVKRVGPDGAPVHVFVVDVGHPAIVEIDGRGEAIFPGWGVGVAGYPHEDLGIVAEDGVDLLVGLGDGVGGVDPVAVVV